MKDILIFSFGYLIGITSMVGASYIARNEERKKEHSND